MCQSLTIFLDSIKKYEVIHIVDFTKNTTILKHEHQKLIEIDRWLDEITIYIDSVNHKKYCNIFWDMNGFDFFQDKETLKKAIADGQYGRYKITTVIPD